MTRDPVPLRPLRLGERESTLVHLQHLLDPRQGPLEILPRDGEGRGEADDVVVGLLAEDPFPEQGFAEAAGAAGRGDVFAIVEPALSGDRPAQPWAELADELGTTEGALRVAAHRLRQKFRKRLEREVRDTLDETDDDRTELDALLDALRS